MTLLDAKPAKPPRKIGRYVLMALGVAVLGVIAFIVLRNFPEERAVSRFLTALEQGNYREAYRLWQPSASYSYDDFLHDWGAGGDYGKIHDYKILGSRSQGSATVVVIVSINGEQPPRELVVDRKTKGLAFYDPFLFGASVGSH